MVITPLLLSSLMMTMSGSTSFYDVSQHYDYSIQLSLTTRHFNPRPEHHNTQQFKGIERYGANYFSRELENASPSLRTSTPLLGFAYFRNSYDQGTVYAYTGYRKPLLYNYEAQIYAKVTAGLIHGYRDRYRGRIPFNQLGIAPAVIPSVGVQYKRANMEMIFFSLSGVMLNIGYSF